jgi:toxin-antitoxin system PIN domain toxin
MLVDINLLIYATATQSPHHSAARIWFEDAVNGSAMLGLPWASLLGYLRVVTNPRIFRPAVAVSDAWATVSDWLAHDSVWTPSPTDQHEAILGELLKLPGMHGNLIPDAHLAALAIEHGLTLCSTDGDFARFPDLRWVNPLDG